MVEWVVNTDLGSIHSNQIKKRKISNTFIFVVDLATVFKRAMLTLYVPTVVRGPGLVSTSVVLSFEFHLQ